MLEVLRETLVKAPVVKFNDYDYFVYPITDGIPHISPDLLRDIADGMAKVANLAGCDKILTAEAMGIHLAAALSLKTGLPFTIIRKRKYGLEDEVEFEQRTGYSTRKMYINGLKKGEKVVFVDDVLSTGGTLRAVVNTLRKIGVQVQDIVIVINKSKEKAKLEKELGQEIKTLVNIEIRDGAVRVLD